MNTKKTVYNLVVKQFFYFCLEKDVVLVCCKFKINYHQADGYVFNFGSKIKKYEFLKIDFSSQRVDLNLSLTNNSMD